MPSDESRAQIEANFTWGKVRKIHEVGPYLIVESDARPPDNAKPDWEPHVDFHSYVRDPDRPRSRTFCNTSHSYDSLDAALVACVVFRREWATRGINAALNQRLSGYVMRALRGPRDDD